MASGKKAGPLIDDEREALHKAPAVVFQGNPKGPMFRGKRVALGLSIRDIGAPPMVRGRWYKYEDGGINPPGGWDMWFERLDEALRKRVQLHVDLGGDPLELRLNPWSTAEIMKAAGINLRVEAT